MLFNLAIPQQDDPISESHCLNLIMGHINHGSAQFLVQALNLSAHFITQLRIKIAQGFVKQKQARIADNSATDGNALPLPPRECLRQALQKRRDTEHISGAVHTFVNFLRFKFAGAQTKCNIFKHIEIGVKRIILEYHGNVAVSWALPCNILVTNFNLACARFFKASNGAQQSGFAAARWANQHCEFSRWHFNVHAFHGVECAIIFMQPGDFEICHYLTFDCAHGYAAHQISLHGRNSEEDGNGSQN